MNKNEIAFLFPGQGSQSAGMGKALAEAYPAAREIFDRADEIAGRSISGLCFEGPEEELRKTSNTQPCLFVASAAALAVARAEGIEAEFAAGHSLGEYTALYAAGALDFETGLRLVEARGAAMEKAGRGLGGTMAAVLGLEIDAVRSVCDEASEAGIVAAANWNSPQQIVISGDEAGIAKAIELAKAAGAKRAMPLNVGGAFHSPLMEPVADEMRPLLEAAEIGAPQIRFVANYTADFAQDAELIRTNLIHQITACVRWSESVERMAEAGAKAFIEIGPGKILSGLTKRIARGSTILNLDAPERLEKIRESL